MRTLVLLGSGEFTPSMKDTDKYLISINNSLSVTVLPTAAGKEEDADKWIEKAKNHFLELGVEVKGLRIYSPEDIDNNEYIQEIENSSFIYFSGGDPAYLNSTINGSKVWNVIKNKYTNGAILAGSSAGAMVMGNDILTNPMNMAINGPEFDSGLGLIDYQVIPHFNMLIRFGGMNILKKLIDKADTAKKWIGIEEDTALVITDEKKAEVMGKGNVYLYVNNTERKYKPKANFEI